MKKIITLFALLFAMLTFAQTIDHTFNPTDIGFGNGDGANDKIAATAFQSDGKILVGGDFTAFNGTGINGLVRLNADGTLDTGFKVGIGAEGKVHSVILQSDGKILVAGWFYYQGDGASHNSIARLNTDGTLDTTFNPGTGANNMVESMVLQPDGKIIIAGGFSTYNGIARNGVARLNSDGSLDTSFNPGTGANNAIYSIALQSDGRILIGGMFTAFNGSLKNNIARLNANGTVDPTFNIDDGCGSTVFNIAVQPDQKILVGGQFYACNGTGSAYITRINTDGSIDNTFDSGKDLFGTVVSIALQSDGRIIIGGAFSVNNVSNIARLNTNGSLDKSFDPGIGTNGIVHCLTIKSDGKILAAGEVKSLNGIPRRSLALLNIDGTLDVSFNKCSGASEEIQALATQTDGKIIAGGRFDCFNNLPSNHIIRLNTDGNPDVSFNQGGTGANGNVNSITVQPDGKILVGGQFSYYNKVNKYYIARLNEDGTLDTGFNVSNGLYGDSVLTMVLQPDGKIIVGGNFYSYNGIKRNNVLRLNADGSLDQSFNPGTGANSRVKTIALQSDGKILIGGFFTSYNGIIRNRLARLNADGSIDSSFDIGTAANGSVESIICLSDGKILVGGGFTSFNGSVKSSLLRLNADGSIDVDFDGGVDSLIKTIVLMPNEKILVGGNFTMCNNTAAAGLACLKSDGSLDSGFNFGTGFNCYNCIYGMNVENPVNSIALQSDGKIIAAGGFNSFNGIGRNRIARLNMDTPSLGLNDCNLEKSIQLYPNPVSDILTIASQKNILSQVEIYDTLGKCVKTTTSFDNRFDVSSLSSGIYILKATGENNAVYRSKFVKN